MATRAPPQSRNQTLYSSSKIWKNNNSNHGNALHLQCLTVCSLSQAWFRFGSRVSRGSCRQSDKCYLHLLDEKLDSQRTNSFPYSTQMAYSGPFPLAMQINTLREGEAIWCMLNQLTLSPQKECDFKEIFPSLQLLFLSLSLLFQCLFVEDSKENFSRPQNSGTFGHSHYFLESSTGWMKTQLWVPIHHFL